MLAQPTCKTACLQCHLEQHLLVGLLQNLQQHNCRNAGMYTHKKSAQAQDTIQCIKRCYCQLQSACHHIYQRLPHEGRYMKVTGAASGADDSRVIGPALGWRPLCLHPKPNQTFDINHEHVVLELAGIIHASKDEQAALRQHSAAVASACWQWLACLPCMAPYNISAFAFIESKDDGVSFPAVRYVP